MLKPKLGYRKFGCHPDLPDFRDPKYSAYCPKKMGLAEPVTADIDLRPFGPPVKDQEDTSSCTGHGVSEAMEFLQLQEEKLNLSGPSGLEVFDAGVFEPLSVFFPYFNGRDAEGDANEDGGAAIRDVVNAVGVQGVCRNSTWPFIASNVTVKPSAAAYIEGAQHKEVHKYRISNLDDMLNCLKNGYPFIIGVTLYDSFMGAAVAKNGMVPMPAPSENVQGGHCMIVMGALVTQKLFIVQNSWGTNWADKGFCYLPFDYLTSSDLCSDCWTLRRM